MPKALAVVPRHSSMTATKAVAPGTVTARQAGRHTQPFFFTQPTHRAHRHTRRTGTTDRTTTTSHGQRTEESPCQKGSRTPPPHTTPGPVTTWTTNLQTGLVETYQTGRRSSEEQPAPKPPTMRTLLQAVASSALASRAALVTNHATPASARHVTMSATAAPPSYEKLKSLLREVSALSEIQGIVRRCECTRPHAKALLTIVFVRVRSSSGTTSRSSCRRVLQLRAPRKKELLPRSCMRSRRGQK
jgi:hypothetical protein